MTTQETAKAATPLMQQYLRIKATYPDEILFFRLGDFYEMFFDDAVRAAPLLEVALTQRQAVPMCGIPHHAATAYIAKLLRAGVRVAIAEQLEDPKKTKGMVKRDVVRIVTPGTVVEEALLPARTNNFLVSVTVGRTAGQWAVAAADVSTGRLWLGSESGDLRWNGLRAQLAALDPSEVLWAGGSPDDAAFPVNDGRLARVSEPAPGEPLPDAALRALRDYLSRDGSGVVKSLGDPEPLPTAGSDVVFLDETAIRHLELVESLDPAKTGPTLCSIVDRSVTSLGSRQVRWWLLHPSTDPAVIDGRLDAVEAFLDASAAREDIRRLLKKSADLERIGVRAKAGSASPRDLEALRTTLETLPELQAALNGVLLTEEESPFHAARQKLDVPGELLNVLRTQLADEPPARLADGGAIRSGVSAELDDLRNLRRNSKKWIAEMEAAERERTGIGSLKVGYNDVFGYYLEVSRSNLSKVPADWIRKQTLANGERYITPGLKEQEEKILGAEEKIGVLEARLFSELMLQVASYGPTISRIAEAIACLDALAGLAQAASENGFVRPAVHDGDGLVIRGGRHPVIEREIGRERFIPNDVDMESSARRIAVITGPNMAGKSTYLRQTALIAILAQMGSFVPAQSASIGIVDKIFTRIGASDRLAQGQSTFMVEMKEVAALLAAATSRSLLVLDEVGRGTSTYDGLSIAWAVIEYLATLGGKSGTLAAAPRTLFATHYFELTQLAGRLNGVFNAHATAKEWPGPDGRRQVVFLYQILPGAADRSYGIHVAEMAGLPAECVERASEILKELEAGNTAHTPSPARPSAQEQLQFFSDHPIVEEIRRLDVNGLTPLEALNKLAALKRSLTKE